MRAAAGLLLTAMGLAVCGALEVTNGRVDEEHEAIVVEAYSTAARRQGRQFAWFSGSPSTPFQGIFPASTFPLAPAGQQLLCKSPTGQMALCLPYGWGQQGGSSPWRQPQQWPGQQWAGQGGGQYPGQGGQWQGQYPGQGGQGGGQNPGQGGQGGGQNPGQGGQGGGQYPGQGGQWQGQYPGQGGQGGGQNPGQGGQGGGQYPGQGAQGGGWGGPPAWEGSPAPAPVQPAPAPVQPVQPVQQPQPVPQPSPVVAETPKPATVRPPGSSSDQCGVGRYFPIRYKADGQVAEEFERVEGAGARIVSGWNADEGEWPWIAALLNNGRQFCGGSLITRKHILTAAHCVAHMSRYDVANLKVRLGDHAIKQTGEAKVWESKAARVVRHKEFSQQTLHKDVAIITLEDEVPELANVRPVCLAQQDGPTLVDQTATVVGWGSLKENGPQPDILQEVTVRIWDNKVCKETYGPAAPGGILDHMLCAGQKGKDSCSGDSGGPMQIGSGDTWTQIGVVSWGIGCGKSHYPGVYSRVSSLRDWIDKITKDY